MKKIWRKWFEPKAFNSGFLPENEGHQVFFCEYGNPKGKPVLFFHGGPGGGARATHAKGINLKKYRAIMFDQRGCSNSIPQGKLENNTTDHLLNDACRLLNYLKINKKIILRGASWGSTLALLFAERYPQKVEKMLLSQVFLADTGSSWWEFEGCYWHYPEFVELLESKANGDVREYFAQKICSDDEKQQLEAANYYGYYERVCCSLDPKWSDCLKLDEKSLAGHRVFMHYSNNNFFINPSDAIMNNIEKIKNIPTIIIHNRLDFVCPVKGAYELHKQLKDSKLIIVPEFGHVGKLLSKTITRVFREELK